MEAGEIDPGRFASYQKIVEETPSPAVTPDLRARMGEAAVAAARWQPNPTASAAHASGSSSAAAAVAVTVPVATRTRRSATP